MLRLNRDYSAGYGMKPMVAHVCAGTVFWMSWGDRLIKIAVETNPGTNGFQDYLIYYGHGKNEKPVKFMAQASQMYVWFQERWAGLFCGVNDE